MIQIFLNEEVRLKVYTNDDALLKTQRANFKQENAQKRENEQNEGFFEFLLLLMI